jgi:hypothetical protein
MLLLFFFRFLRKSEEIIFGASRKGFDVLSYYTWFAQLGDLGQQDSQRKLSAIAQRCLN